MTRILAGAAIACAAALVAGTAMAQDGAACDRACLEGFADAYVAALGAQDPSLAPLAAGARYTENGQELAVGDGLWGTISSVGSYQLYISDPQTGQVGFFGTIREAGDPVPIAHRLKIRDGAITEIETILPRGGSGFGGGGTPGAVKLEESGPNPLFLEALPEDERLPRARLIEIADGYFEAMEQGDSSAGWFAEDCSRIENGNRMAGNPDAGVAGSGVRMGAMYCAEQFDTGYSRGFSFIPYRRYPVVDEERGLVLSVVALQHNGRQDEMVVNGVASPMAEIFRKPYQFTMAELFKIDDGALRVVEAVLFTAPYGMRSGWQDEACDC